MINRLIDRLFLQLSKNGNGREVIDRRSLPFQRGLSSWWCCGSSHGSTSRLNAADIIQWWRSSSSSAAATTTNTGTLAAVLLGYSATTTRNPRHNWSATGHADNRSAAGDPVRVLRDRSLVTSHSAAAAAASATGWSQLPTTRTLSAGEFSGSAVIDDAVSQRTIVANYSFHDDHYSLTYTTTETVVVICTHAQSPRDAPTHGLSHGKS